MGGLDLIMAMGEGGLEVNWSKIKIWTLGNKAKRACKIQKEFKSSNSREIQMQSLEGQKPGCHSEVGNLGAIVHFTTFLYPSESYGRQTLVFAKGNLLLSTSHLPLGVTNEESCHSASSKFPAPLLGNPR